MAARLTRVYAGLVSAMLAGTAQAQAPRSADATAPHAHSSFVDQFVEDGLRELKEAAMTPAERVSRENRKIDCKNIGYEQGNTTVPPELREIKPSVARNCTEIGVPLKPGTTHDPQYKGYVPHIAYPSPKGP